ncbi:MAG: sodium-dependent transporter [Candidatus Hydrothermales bacterium]
MNKRERWATRIGLILAMAGNAVGLGNFLRFPVQAAKNGGGAFMIPYFISLLLLGIPLMWVEWAIGRYGGKFGHGTSPGMFDKLWRNRIAKYLGVIGLAGPIAIVIYYVYIESWTLGYAILSLFGKLPKVKEGQTFEEINSTFGGFLSSYAGFNEDPTIFLKPSLFSYVIFLLTLFLNFFILARGISAGIEAFAKFAMPTLFIFALILLIRVLTLGSPVDPETSVLDGLGFLWNPNFSSLLDPNVWLAAAGQIFFTLSVGMGAILTYASYLREKDDIALSGLSTASLNEFAEVVLGGSIAIPAAVAFFGLANAKEIAHSGAFNLAFVSVPAIFSFLPLGFIFGFLWFSLLFFAGITSSIALTQPAIAFLEDEFKIKRSKAVLLVFVFIFIFANFSIFIKGFLDEMDFWVGTFFITFFALVETVIFVWIFGPDRAWEEINKGADIKIPRIFYYILKYITPVILIIIFTSWIFQNVGSIFKETSPGKWIARIFILSFFLFTSFLVYLAFKKEKKS